MITKFSKNIEKKPEESIDSIIKNEFFGTQYWITTGNIFTTANTIDMEFKRKGGVKVGRKEKGNCRGGMKGEGERRKGEWKETEEKKNPLNREKLF